MNLFHDVSRFYSLKARCIASCSSNLILGESTIFFFLRFCKVVVLLMVNPRLSETGSWYSCGLIIQCVVLLLFADVDVRVLVAVRFRMVGTSEGKVWTCALPSRGVK